MREEDRKDISDLINISIKSYFNEKEAREKPKKKSKFQIYIVPLVEGAVSLYLLYVLYSFVNKL